MCVYMYVPAVQLANVHKLINNTVHECTHTFTINTKQHNYTTIY